MCVEYAGQQYINVLFIRFCERCVFLGSVQVKSENVNSLYLSVVVYKSCFVTSQLFSVFLRRKIFRRSEEGT